jgi:cell division protein FtsL
MAKIHKYRIKWFRLTVVLLAGYFFYMMAGQQSQLDAIERERQAATQRLEQAQQQNAALAEERNRLNDPAYIEKLARDELGLAKPGETPYMPRKKN